MRWIATSYGALDVSLHPHFEDIELLVAPVKPGIPLAVASSGAKLWRRLAEGPVDDAVLDEEDLSILREMAEAGLASVDLDNAARQGEICSPWFSSPMHELVYAIVSRVARNLKIPVVFIKGPALYAQGLRKWEHSGDVDVWVDPSRIEELAQALNPWGWSVRSHLWGALPAFHSVTLVPENGWGCEIDLHRRFPGVNLADQEAFLAIEEKTEVRYFAGVEGDTPVKSAAAVLAALHWLRPLAGVETSVGTKEMAAEVLRQGGQETIQDAKDMAALAALQEALPDAFPQTHIDFRHARVSSDWLWHSQPSKAQFYLKGLKGVAWWRKPDLVWKIIWPPKEFVLSSQRNAGHRATGVFKARLQRLWRGVREMLGKI